MYCRPMNVSWIVNWNVVQRVMQPKDSYRAGNEIYSAYLLTDFYPTEALLVNLGLRYEMSKQWVRYASDGGDWYSRRRNLDKNDLFPALNLKYAVNPANSIRFSASRTVTRPSFIEMALYNDYPALFNSNSLSSMPEVLLWRAYDANLTPAVNHFVVGYLQRNGGGNSGYTRSMINTYLMQNGLPIYAAGTDYKGDRTYQDVAEGRDPRLTYNTLMPGDMLTEKAAMTEAIIDGAGYYYRAPITEMAENRSTTGYSIKKGLNTEPSQGPTLPSTTACVIFRAAEAYLNYMEADYELNHSLDAKSKGYWEAIRRRAGMDTDYEKTNRNTDLTKEIDLARYSGNNLVDVTLYNIRRERRVELAAEGFRLRDLRRWCALDKMQNYQVEGFNLWAENYKRYATPDAGISVFYRCMQCSRKTILKCRP